MSYHTGSCCFCGKELNDAPSLERGYGPICADRYMQPHGSCARLGTVQDNVDEVVQTFVDYCKENGLPHKPAETAWAAGDSWAAANKIVFAVSRPDVSAIELGTKALYAMGWTGIAGIIASENGVDGVPAASKSQKVNVAVEDSLIKVDYPYHKQAIEAARKIPGQRYDRVTRATFFPQSAKDAVESWLRTYFPLVDVSDVLDSIDLSNINEADLKVVKLSLDDSWISIDTPYSPDFVGAIKMVQERRWDGKNKVWMVPVAQASQAIQTVYKFWKQDEVHVPKAIEELARNAQSSNVKTYVGEVFRTNGHIGTRTPYNASFVADVKDIPGRRWNKDLKIWTVPADRAKCLLSLVADYWNADDINVSEEVIELLKEQVKDKKLAEAVSADTDLSLPGGEMYPFQGVGVEFLTRKGSGLIADEMGLGKTIQALGYLERTKNYPALIVVPASLKINWQREAAKWTTARPAVILTGTKACKVPETDIVIINHDVLQAWEKELAKVAFSTLIVDEAHYAKNSKASRSKALRTLALGDSKRIIGKNAKSESIGAKGIKHRILLTGTPVMNKPKDLWHLLFLLDPSTWGSFFYYGKKYCGGYNNGYGWNFDGASNTAELHNRLIGHYAVRRVKENVLKDLPKKRRVEVALELSREVLKRYQQNVAEIERELERLLAEDPDSGKAKAKAIVFLNAMRKEAATAKIGAAIEWAEEALQSMDKLIIFAHHNEVVKAVSKHFGAPSILGETSSKKRQEAVDSFQNDPEVKVIVCSIMAAGVGLTLTASHNVATLERVWREADHAQAEDRAHRIGQELPVTSWYLDAANTVDDAMTELIKEKAGHSSAIVDGEDYKEIDVMKLARRVIEKRN